VTENPSGPLSLASISSTYIGGRRLEWTGRTTADVALSSALQHYHYDPDDAHHVEHVYVQRFVPTEPCS
jgi:hypothetical protein